MVSVDIADSPLKPAWIGAPATLVGRIALPERLPSARVVLHGASRCWTIIGAGQDLVTELATALEGISSSIGGGGTVVGCDTTRRGTGKALSTVAAGSGSGWFRRR